MSDKPEYCRHYNKGENVWAEKCAAGISYSSVFVKGNPGNPYPCYNPLLRQHCQHWAAKTEEQIKAEQESLKEAAQTLENFARMLEGKAETCLRCHQPIEKLEQVGRSVYARPCNCRQYQGKVPKK